MNLPTDVHIGRARTAGPLALAPVFTDSPGPEYLTGSDALAAGWLTIGELAGGNVPSLVVANAADRAVLLLDGEHLAGAMQNRVLNTSVLLPAQRETVIPVSCVEAQRWSYGGEVSMRADQDMAYVRFRERKAQQVVANIRGGRGFVADQGDLWDDIERRRDEVGAPLSATRAMADIYEDRRPQLEQILGTFPGPEAGQTGVIGFIGGHPIVADLFDRPETLRSVWRRLIGGYALDALGHRSRTPDAFSARGFLAELADPEREQTTRPSVGLGEDVSITTERAVARGLVWERTTVHLALFSTVPSRGRQPRGGTMAPPRRRRDRDWFGSR